MAAHPSQQPTRSAGQIEADLNATRQRLTASVEALIDQVHPNRIKQRSASRLRQLVEEQKQNAKALLFNARGDLRKDRLTAVGGAVAGFVGFLVIVRALVRRGRRG